MFTFKDGTQLNNPVSSHWFRRIFTSLKLPIMWQNSADGIWLFISSKLCIQDGGQNMLKDRVGTSLGLHSWLFVLFSTNFLINIYLVNIYMCGRIWCETYFISYAKVVGNYLASLTSIFSSGCLYLLKRTEKFLWQIGLKYRASKIVKSKIVRRKIAIKNLIFIGEALNLI